MTSPRLTAAQMLQEILEKRIFLSEAKARYGLQAEKDYAFINMLLLTSLRRLVYLRRILKNHVKKPLPAPARLGTYLLILGAAEILYMQTPDYAAINDYVEIAKQELDSYVAGFINAVLRKIAANRQKYLEDDQGDFFTSEFYKILNHGYGKKTVRKLEAAAQQEALLDITVKNNASEWAETLGGALLPNGTVRLANQGNITKLSGYEEGAWWVQDFSASLAAQSLQNAIKGKRVLDLCAAPGGKTAQLISMGAMVTAVDISAPRLEILKTNLQRLHLEADEIICADALEYIDNFAGEPFDAVLLDAPCSATGTLRRHPEMVHIKTLEDVQKQAAIQKQILDKISPLIRSDGFLVYCVCSLSPSEGSSQIMAFLENNPQFVIESLQSSVTKTNPEIVTPQGFIQTLPCHLSDYQGCDGFFIAKLQKKG